MSRLRTLLLFTALLVAAVPAAASAYEPYAETDYLTVTSGTTARFGGYVETGGEATDANFKWDGENSDFCLNEDGTQDSAFESSPAHLDPAQGDEWDVFADVTGLTGGSWYCFVLMATNASGTSDGGFGWFLAGAPDAYTDYVDVTGADTATVRGSVYPAGQTVSYYAEYDDVDSDWCSSDGEDGAPAHATGPLVLGATDSTADHDVTVDVTGLEPGADYCIQIVAHNDFADVPGGQVWFRAGYPDAYTSDAEETSATSASVSGEVNPSGQDTSYHVEYDVEGSEWCDSWGESGTPAGKTDPVPLVETDSDYHAVSVDLTGLTPGSHYCAELVAHNGSGDAFGDFVFVTTGHAHAAIVDAKATGTDGARVTGTVNPAVQTATYKVNYDLMSSTWCQTSGGESSPANSTATATLPDTDDASHDVTVDLSGLTPGALYCVELVAHNGLGDVSGGFKTVTAGLPVVSLGEHQPDGPSSERLAGAVTPSNQETMYWFEYALEGSEFCDSGGQSGESTSTYSRTLESTDTSAHAVTEWVELASDGSYCVRLVAQNGAGRVATETGPLGIPHASVFTDSAAGITTTAATLRAVVQTAGMTTSWRFQYAAASSEFCKTGGVSGPRSQTSDGSIDGAVPQAAVSMRVTGLVPGTDYCYLADTTNLTGAASGALRTLRTVTPPLKPAAVVKGAIVRRVGKAGRFDAGFFRCTSAARCFATISIRRARPVGSGAVTLKPGTSGWLYAALTKPALKALVKAKTLTVTVTAKVTSKGAATVVKQFPLTLKAPPK